ncbi:PXMP2/4 family protein 3 [Cydia pomonella]|uniref:PXMP2/4 family protein 3 n=1 Tax=Cydia pomonella TaxID=82600 RepID=UPI002ADDBF4E|nr:PXMP2/4 family protein 3 [Cydia pomonella]
MALSKPIMNLVASYLQNLYLNPIKTKAITSCVVGSAASIVSQVVAGDCVRLDPVLAFGLYGLLFGGTIPHYFYNIAERLFPEEVVAFPLAKKLLFERLVFAPFMQAFSLYTLARFEGKNHSAALKQLYALYSTVLEANWKWLTLFQVINLAFVPPMLRVLFMNLVGFGWAMFLATKRRQRQQKEERKE